MGMKPRVKWDDLRIFLEVARQGSVHAAAKKLKLDHSTVCRRIGKLEDLLAIKLLDRVAARHRRCATASSRLLEPYRTDGNARQLAGGRARRQPQGRDADGARRHHGGHRQPVSGPALRR